MSSRDDLAVVVAEWSHDVRCDLGVEPVDLCGLDLAELVNLLGLTGPIRERRDRGAG